MSPMVWSRQNASAQQRLIFAGQPSADYPHQPNFGGIIWKTLFNRRTEYRTKRYLCARHNDLGFGGSQLFSAVGQGARQGRGGQFNGFGLSEQVTDSLWRMPLILQTRHGLLGVNTNIREQESSSTLKFVQQLYVNMPVKPTKAMWGAECFRSLIRAFTQDRVCLKKRNTYEIQWPPESVRYFNKNKLKLTSRSGRTVISTSLDASLGYKRKCIFDLENPSMKALLWK